MTAVVAQRWGCKNCKFKYDSPVNIRALNHHCSMSFNVKPAILVEQVIPIRKGRVLKRRKRG